MTPETSLSSKSGPRSRWNREDLIEEVRFAHDSPLEGDGFELPAPLRASSARWCVEQHRLVDSWWSFTIATRAGARLRHRDGSWWMDWSACVARRSLGVVQPTEIKIAPKSADASPVSRLRGNGRSPTPASKRCRSARGIRHTSDRRASRNRRLVLCARSARSA